MWGHISLQCLIQLLGVLKVSSNIKVRVVKVEGQTAKAAREQNTGCIQPTINSADWCWMALQSPVSCTPAEVQCIS